MGSVPPLEFPVEEVGTVLWSTPSVWNQRSKEFPEDEIEPGFTAQNVPNSAADSSVPSNTLSQSLLIG